MLTCGILQEDSSKGHTGARRGGGVPEESAALDPQILSTLPTSHVASENHLNGEQPARKNRLTQQSVTKSLVEGAVYGSRFVRGTKHGQKPLWRLRRGLTVVFKPRYWPLPHVILSLDIRR